MQIIDIVPLFSNQKILFAALMMLAVLSSSKGNGFLWVRWENSNNINNMDFNNSNKKYYDNSDSNINGNDNNSYNNINI